jgi:dipeptidyl aminopeptidase/acylaminoacyl peptidase
MTALNAPWKQRFRVPLIIDRITHFEQLRAPLLIFQGSNDMRYPPGQLRAYEGRAPELGKAIEVVWFDAGHVGPTTEQTIGFVEQTLAFAHRVFSEPA